MTAGHCISDGGVTNSWSANDETNTPHLIGPAYGFSFAGPVGQDEGVIQVSPDVWGTVASLIVMASNATAYDNGYAISHTSWSSMGQVLCRTGAKTGTECAEVSALGADESGPGFMTRQMGELDMCAALPGDSGGPIYKMGRAYGIFEGTKAFKPIHCYEAYQGIRAAEGTLNVDVILRP